jgi:hypothetical protein
MLTKVLITAAAAGLISTAAFAQDEESKPQEQSATSPNTVNPVQSSETTAPTGQATDVVVVAMNADEARARGIAVETIASAPVPDTPANRRAYGQPLSNAGRNTAPRGN